MIAVINDFNAKMFTCNGITYVRNFISVRRGEHVSIRNAYDSRFALVSGHYSEFTVNGNTFASASSLTSVLSPMIFVKDEVEMTGPSESNNTVADAVFYNIFGTWVKTPSEPASGTINLDLTAAVNGGVCAVYYSGPVIDNDTFTGGAVVMLSGTNVLNELCIVWIVYDQGNNSFSVNIQNGSTGDIPDPGEPSATAPTITVTEPSGPGAPSATAPTITVTE